MLLRLIESYVNGEERESFFENLSETMSEVGEVHFENESCQQLVLRKISNSLLIFSLIISQQTPFPLISTQLVNVH
jgi:hypothetical protein